MKLTFEKCERIAAILKEMKKTLETESKNNKDYMFIQRRVFQKEDHFYLESQDIAKTYLNLGTIDQDHINSLFSLSDQFNAIKSTNDSIIS